MTKEKFQKWMNDAVFIETAEEFRDSCDNFYHTEIYERDGKFYAVDYLERVPLAKFVDNKFIHDEIAEPRKVTRKTKMIEHVYYE